MTASSQHKRDYLDSYLNLDEKHFIAVGDRALGEGWLDTSTADHGYVVVASVPEEAMALVVRCGEQEDVFYLPAEGTRAVIPLKWGNGKYEFTLLQHLSEAEYALVDEGECVVEIVEEIAAFIRPHIYCWYTKESSCVVESVVLAQNVAGEEDLVFAVCRWVKQNIAYDQELCDSIRAQGGNGPTPVPDLEKVMAAGKGICVDQASLIAAMLRCQGVPCKIVIGRLAPGQEMHAWNSVYIDGAWRHLDLGDAVDEVAMEVLKEY
ncbi:MAG: transglutaminase-like domain-containing protein [Eggerthellaceae bacterium]|nr:transglutaminase-like domain-containing protein [Eggerthellaceae bacterium]